MSILVHPRAELLKYAALLSESGDKVNSCRIYHHLLQLNASDPEALLGMKYISGEHDHDAPLVTTMEGYLDLSPTELTMSEIEEMLSRPDMDNKERSYLFVAAGVLSFKEGNLLAARHSFDGALLLDKENYRAHCGLAMIHWRRRRFHDAWLEFMASLDLEISNIPALLGLLRVAQPLGRIGLARCYLKRYLTEHPERLELWILLARVDIMVGRMDEALKAIKRVLRQDSGHIEAKKLLDTVSTS